MESGTVIAILPCNDLDASERFYGRLGFSRIEGRPPEELPDAVEWQGATSFDGRG